MIKRLKCLFGFHQWNTFSRRRSVEVLQCRVCARCGQLNYWHALMHEWRAFRDGRDLYFW